MIQQQPKWNLHWKAGVANKVKFVLGVSTRTKYEMKSVIQTATEKLKSMFESRKWDWNLQLKWHQQCYEIKSAV